MKSKKKLGLGRSMDDMLTAANFAKLVCCLMSRAPDHPHGSRNQKGIKTQGWEDLKAELKLEVSPNEGLPAAV